MGNEEQSKLRIAPQNNDSDGAQRSLTDSDVEELIRFFQLLAEWEREHTASSGRNAR